MRNTSDFFIRVNGHLVPVSKEVYQAYHHSKRRDRFFERDIKMETPVRDKTGVLIGYKPSREDSLDRLVAAGKIFTDAAADVTAQVISTVIMDKLHEALATLPDAERALINALFFGNDGGGVTVRAYADQTGIPYMTVQSRKVRILAKLKKMMGN